CSTRPGTCGCTAATPCWPTRTGRGCSSRRGCRCAGTCPWPMSTTGCWSRPRRPRSVRTRAWRTTGRSVEGRPTSRGPTGSPCRRPCGSPGWWRSSGSARRSWSTASRSRRPARVGPTPVARRTVHG
ncbi:MAG: hypothetical protein AVDCRST_MAG66-4017, partial [uncultured Pseudonocardia sp.]